MWGNLNDSVGNTSGGFLNDSRSSTDRGKVKRGENIIPVMIKHLNDSSAEMKIWDMQARIVTFVGIVRRIERATTKMTYEIEDETGSIMAYRWLEVKEDIRETFKLNTYVRVFGHLREQNEMKHVLILRVRPMFHLNELTNHLLEVTYVMLKLEKMHNMESGSPNNNRKEEVTSDDNLSGLTKEQAIVFRIIQAENDCETGIARDVLKRQVPQNLLSRVDDIIDFLTNEGHIYTTLTDNHFKTT